MAQHKGRTPRTASSNPWQPPPRGVADYFGENILYINVMNNLSVDCDCDSHPADPMMLDVGIFASLDPVALDEACLDYVYEMTPTEGNDNRPS